MFKQMKALITVPVVISTFLVLAGIAYGEEVKAGVINADSVNLRESPATTSKILMELPKDAKLTVVEIQEDWYKVSYNDSKGFVFGQYVTLQNVVIDTGTINGTNVNVRSKGTTDAEILTRLDKGAKVDIYEYSGSWARIGIGEGRYGWVFADYVTSKKGNVSRGASEKDTRTKLVEYAKKFLGVKYVYGGSSAKGFDCSGFTSFVFKQFGISIERTAASQGSNGAKIDRSDLRAGDLVFFDTNGGKNAINHVGIYIGGGKFIHASSGSAYSVTISELSEGFYDERYMRSRRYIKD